MFARVITAQAGAEGFDGPSGIREQHNPATAGLTAQHVETYEVTMHI